MDYTFRKLSNQISHWIWEVPSSLLALLLQIQVGDNLFCCFLILVIACELKFICLNFTLVKWSSQGRKLESSKLILKREFKSLNKGMMKMNYWFRIPSCLKIHQNSGAVQLSPWLMDKNIKKWLEMMVLVEGQVACTSCIFDSLAQKEMTEWQFYLHFMKFLLDITFNL